MPEGKKLCLEKQKQCKLEQGSYLDDNSDQEGDNLENQNAEKNIPFLMKIQNNQGSFTGDLFKQIQANFLVKEESLLNLKKYPRMKRSTQIDFML
ncbi:hypothetical protein TTHERM_00558260 (macronuclear) [Tetrahymena thermophila SB210]|uniref:Uncharacterized protein n=1 Tax=Tetrahymena thermophila (strain SB210) TaxID=312017 RepID=I7MGY3_TETTS|nr:hypothetical protein TTHERM_00558260 [Tetrahymena thermophila SB210]EAS02144.1 hypothetical protein TTHERM_00558260 [Tetrahymena thermophila SB210]|eukprot:XP_001022389.1 hypothetical protein TTHERM_00558260 [Tetrahymena thermophila SB210]